MNELNQQQKLLMDKAIEQAQECRKLREELAAAKEENRNLRALMDAVIAGFLKTGCAAPNVDAECWNMGRKAYRIVQNDGFFTIGRTEEELEREGRTRQLEGQGAGLPGKERRSLTYTARAKARRRSPLASAYRPRTS